MSLNRLCKITAISCPIPALLASSTTLSFAPGNIKNVSRRSPTLMRRQSPNTCSDRFRERVALRVADAIGGQQDIAGLAPSDGAVGVDGDGAQAKVLVVALIKSSAQRLLKAHRVGHPNAQTGA